MRRRVFMALAKRGLVFAAVWPCSQNAREMYVRFVDTGRYLEACRLRLPPEGAWIAHLRHVQRQPPHTRGCCAPHCGVYRE
jgi:hypothetical protein